MRRLQQFVLAVWLVSPLSLAVAGAPPDDVILQALNDELKRSLTLRLEDLDQPYFIQYSVDDTATYRVSASYGALLSSDQSRSRGLLCQIRVGSYTFDNSNFSGGPGGGGRSGLGGGAQLPTDDDYKAVRQAIWLATDHQFKEAVETITQKRAYLKSRTVEDRPPDFVKAEPTTVLEDRANLNFKTGVWEEYVRRVSARFREFPHIQDADVNLVAGSETRYLMNSEGSQLRYGTTETLFRITAEAQTEDGERLSDHLSYFAPTPEQLPKVEAVLADVDKLAERLAASIRAPVLDDYTGPVLFEGQASTQLFRQLLARGVLGQPDVVGVSRRGGQGTDDLANRLGKRILPQTFQIYDDPRQRELEGTFLAGYYRMDDEAIAPQRVNLVVDGKLEKLLMSRSPTKEFPQTNGHGRRGGSEIPRPAVGCLYIESSKPQSPEDLKKALLDAADAEGLKFGLRVTSIQSRSGALDAGGRSRRGARGTNRSVGDPVALYKVFVSDGHEEPVRGCEFTSLDLPSLRKISAAGSVRTVQNSVIGSTPSSSIIAPALLLPEIELSRIRFEAESKPILTAPHARKTP